MKPRTVLVLAALVVALGLFIWFFERELPSTDEREQRAEHVLNLEPEQVRALRWSWSGGSVALLRVEEDHSKGGWHLRDPFEAPADRWAVDGLLSSLKALSRERTLEGVELSELGLEKPRLQLQIETEQGEMTLEVGVELPVGDSMVVRVLPEPPVVVASSVWSELTREPGDWRRRELFAASRDDIQELRLQRDGDEVVLAKRGEVFWLEAPVGDLAERELASSLMSALTGLRAEVFVDDPEKVTAAGLVPRIEVVLEDAESPLTIELGESVPDQEGRIYARIGAQAFEADSALLEAANRPPEQWRSRRWSSMERWSIDRIEVQDTFVLVRADMEWQQDGETIDSSLVNDLLDTISGARAEALQDDQPPEGEPTLTIILTDGDGAEEQLTLYRDREGTVARVTGREVTLQLSEETAAEVEGRVEAVRDAEPRIEPES